MTQLSACQEKVTKQFNDFLLDDEPILIIEGPPGTGKSWITCHLIAQARSQAAMLKLITGDKQEVNLLLTATTNKAAKVLNEKTHEPTQTIHSLLGLKVKNDHRTGKVSLQKTRNSKIVRNTLIFVDECSMMNNTLLDITKELTEDCKVVFILDPYQLAPVGELTCPVTKLSNKVPMREIMRQKGVGPLDHPIAALGLLYRSAVDTGKFPLIKPNGTSIVHALGPDFQRLVDTEFLLDKGVDHCRILAWSNARVTEYNEHVRSLFFSTPEYHIGEFVVTNKPILKLGTPAATTDQVMKVTNIGSIVAERETHGWWVTLDNELKVFQPACQVAASRVVKEYANVKDWPAYFAAKDFFADLRPTHASTIHKAQGSTFHTAFIDLGDIGRCHNPTDVARLLNVAITRASDKVVFYGDLPSKYGGIDYG